MQLGKVESTQAARTQSLVLSSTQFSICLLGPEEGESGVDEDLL